MGTKTTTKMESTNNKMTEDHVFLGKTHEEIKEIIQNLETQEAQQIQVFQTAQTMILKIQGALDLARQMLPQETKNEAKESN
jgi:hypothetical protein